MIFIIEFVLTILGLIYLIAGRTFGANGVKHPHVRILGGFMVTVIPVVFVIAVGFALVWKVAHPGDSVETLEKDITWPLVGIELVTVIGYAVTAHLWEKSIRRRAMSGGAARA